MFKNRKIKALEALVAQQNIIIKEQEAIIEQYERQHMRHDVNLKHMIEHADIIRLTEIQKETT